MKELILYMAQSLVDHPAEVSVTEYRSGRSTIYELHVADEDLGKVIGRQGRIIRSMRALVKASATKQGVRADLDVA